MSWHGMTNFVFLRVIKMRNSKKLILLVSFIMGMLCNAYADGLTAINEFLQTKNSTISADFTQTVYGKRKNIVSNGKMEIARPNQFRWQYFEDGSMSQLIMSDGKTIYIYDDELQQVTEKKLGKSLGKSPALLLAGGDNIRQDYNVISMPTESKVDWVLLTPKKAANNNGFKSVQIGFNTVGGTLAGMKFIDNFDNKSSITFTNVKTGINFSSREFKFVVAPGVDVIKDNN